jgi:hypothetical protein
MDKHPKDYFVPNFGVDHDILATHQNYRNAGGKLAQKASSDGSVPACNSADFPKCKNEANTVSPWKQRGDLIDQVPNYPAPVVPKPALAQSVPACNSHTHPACKDAVTSAPEHLAPLWKTDVQLIDDSTLVQNDPICNSSGCTQYLHPKKEDDHPINYAVPDFGVDREIKLTKEHYTDAESKHAVDFNPLNLAPEEYD